MPRWFPSLLLLVAAANCGAAEVVDENPPPPIAENHVADSSKMVDLSDPPKQPELILPTAAIPAGELFDASVLAPVPAVVQPALNWKLNGKPADPKHLRVSSDGLSAVVSMPGGTHTLSVFGAWGIVTEGGQVAITLIDLSGEFTVGAPVPPGPTPPGPVPPTPVVEGKRTVVIVHESADQTPAQSRLFTTLRTGQVASYIVAKGHTLLILDDDSVDQNDRPLKVVTDLITLGDPLPFVGILDSNTGAVLHHRPLTPAASAEGVLAVLKENGG